MFYFFGGRCTVVSILECTIHPYCFYNRSYLCWHYFGLLRHFFFFMTFNFYFTYFYHPNIDNDKWESICRVVCMSICGVLVIGTLVMTGIFLAFIPINRSIEAGSNAVSVMYTGAIAVIGTVVGFSVASIEWNTKSKKAGQPKIIITGLNPPYPPSLLTSRLNRRRPHLNPRLLTSRLHPPVVHLQPRLYRLNNQPVEET